MPNPTRPDRPHDPIASIGRTLFRLGASIALVASLAVAAGPAVAAPASAGQVAAQTDDTRLAGLLPARIDLPDGWQPEGITSTGATLYVGSLAGGAIWRGSAITGRGRVLVEPVAGSAAAGIDDEWWHGRLWVAGAGTGQVRAYAADTGRLLRTYQFKAGFVNDLVVTPWAVYATDSVTQQLLVIPLGIFGRLPDASKAKAIPLTGDIKYTDGFNANGITWAHGRLVIVQSNTGKLFRVDPWSAATRAIDTHGYSVVNGDGIEFRDDKLYLVRNMNNLVAVLGVDWRLRNARLIGEIKSRGLDVPTTATFAVGKLWAVNARFGVDDPATAKYWITRLPVRP